MSAARLPRLRGLYLLRLLLALVAVLCLLGGAAHSRRALALDRAPRERALLGTVQVIVPDDDGNPYSGGSGTVLDADQGYILTNYHVMGDVETRTLFNQEGVAVIGINPPNLHSVPVFRYYARMVQGDPEIDLAVLQIVAPFDDPNSRLPSNLGLTAVPRGDSDALLIGDPIYVLGFPGLGGDTVTYTAGTVSGYLDENRDGTEDWIKTDAEVNHGNSGGLAVDDTGAFIGVPSAGLTDVDAAGKISLIRPSNLALGYYDAWTLGGTPPVQSSAPQISQVQYGESVRSTGAVRNPATRFDSGITDLYASIDFRNLPREQELTYRWYLNGAQIDAGTVRRGSSETGIEWVALSDDAGLADGFYELTLWLGGRQIYRGGVAVGAANSDDPTRLGAITFAEGVEADGAPVRPAETFARLGEVFAIFPAQGLHNGVALRSVWSFNGAKVLEDEWAWDQGDVSVAWISITHPDGLPVGDYALELFVEGKPATSGTFHVSEQARAAPTTVNLVGTVRDADNPRRLVNGALVVLLQPGVQIDDWVNADFDPQQMYASGRTTRSGEYQLDQRVETGQTYAVVVVHDDYLPVREDAFQVPADAGDPYVLDIPMTRR